MRILAPALAVLILASCADPAAVAVREADRLVRDQSWEDAAAAYATLPLTAGSWRGYGAWRAGVIYRDPLGDAARARRQFATCAKNYDDEEWGYSCLVELGDLARDSADPRAAIATYRSAIQARPRGRWTEHCLFESGKAYGVLREYEQSRREWGELLARFEGSSRAPEVLLAVARSWDLEGNRKEARTAYQRVHRSYPKHSVAPLAMFGEAESLEQLGDLDKALALYESLRARHPNPPAVDARIQTIRDRQSRRDVESGAVELPDSGHRLRK